MKKAFREHRSIMLICMLIYVVFMGVSLYNDMNFFSFSYQGRVSYYEASGNPYAVFYYLLLKVLFLIIMFIFFQYIAKCWIGVLENDNEIKLRLKIYGVILLVYVITLMHVYPGIWMCHNCDELKLFDFSRCLQVQYHQGVLSSVVYVLALMCYPSPVMVVLFQTVLGVIILGNIAYDLYYENNKFNYWFFLLVLSPASLYFAMYPLRAYLFAIFFLVFIHYYLKICKHKYTDRKHLYVLTFFLCIVINYRTEAKFLLLIFPFLLYKHFSKQLIVKAGLIALCSIFLFSGINTLGFQGSNKAHNSIMMTGPISMFLVDSNRDKTDYEQDILNIDKVINVDMMMKYASYSYAHGERPDDSYTDEELFQYYKSALKIITRNPDIYFKAKVTCAMDSLGMTEYNYLGYEFPGEVKPESIAPYFADVNKADHDLFGKILVGQYKFINIKTYYLFYAFWLPCLLLVAVFFIGLKKDRPLAIASGIICIHFCLTVLTAPTKFQMYYYAQYLIGWYLIIYASRYLPLKSLPSKTSSAKIKQK